MSKATTRAAAKGPAKTPPRPIERNHQAEVEAEPDWLRPVSDAAPCGPNLEYDAAYAALTARLAPQAEAQYGEFVGRPDAPDWSDIERECQRLLARSKDLTVLLWLARCRTRLGGAAGLRDALAMLAAVVARYPDDVHPQRIIEGEPDPEVRANALAAFVDPDGLLSDIRDIVIAPSAALRLTVKDVERANAVPRPTDALSTEGVHQQLAEMRTQGDVNVLALGEAAALARQIDRWSQSDLGDAAPDLRTVLLLLGWFEIPAKSTPTPVSTTPAPASVIPARTPDMAACAPEPARPLVASAAPGGTYAEQREQVRASLRAAKEWLEQHEPSSPVAVLLKQAERLLGKRFAEVAQAIPADLLARWDAEA